MLSWVKSTKHKYKHHCSLWKSEQIMPKMSSGNKEKCLPMFLLRWQTRQKKNKIKLTRTHKNCFISLAASSTFFWWIFFFRHNVQPPPAMLQQQFCLASTLSLIPYAKWRFLTYLDCFFPFSFSLFFHFCFV